MQHVFKMRWVAGVGCSVLQILLILTSLHSILSPRNIAAHRQAQQVHHGPTGTTHLYSFRTLSNFNGFNFVGIMREVGARSQVPAGGQLDRRRRPTTPGSRSLDGNLHRHTSAKYGHLTHILINTLVRSGDISTNPGLSPQRSSKCINRTNHGRKNKCKKCKSVTRYMRFLCFDCGDLGKLMCPYCFT